MEEFDHDQSVMIEEAVAAYPFIPACEVYPAEPISVPFPQINEQSARQFLTAYSWPIGLQDLYIRSCKNIPMRFVIVDDSGSMSTCDGRRFVVEGSKQG